MPNKREQQMPQTLLRRVRAGERKTYSEWSKEFGVFPKHIMTTLGRLRKRGIMLYPVGSGFKKEGIIMEVTKRYRDYHVTMERLKKGYLHPHFVGDLRLREQYLIADPSRRGEIEMTATQFVKFVEDSTQKLLGKK